MRKKNKEIIAICCADIHLSLNAPIWRSAEPDWFEAMARPLSEITKLQEKYNCPILCAGDIFDRWNSPPELTNWAGDHLPKMYAIPGQHDLPLHNFEDIKKSAYWNLVKQGIIYPISATHITKIKDNLDITLFGFPFGYQIVPCMAEVNKKIIMLAIVHEYKWIEGKSYPNAPKENKLNRKRKLGYDIIVYGDNHKGFQTNIGSTEIFNCGSLMRRKSDEINYKPQVGLLLETGEVKPYYLDTSKDKYLEIMSTDNPLENVNMKSFIQELEKLGDTDLDFTEAMKHYLQKNKILKPIQNIIMKAMGA